MPTLFENLNPTPSEAPQRAVGTLGETAASDLSTLASRAQKRQEQITQNPLSKGALFPIQQVQGTIPDLLNGGGPTGQSNGVPGIANPISNAAVAGSAENGIVGLGDFMPTTKPTAMETTPPDISYTELSPTQRNRALSSLKVEVTDYATDPETNEVLRSNTGASVLAVQTKAGNQLFLAEDGMAAQSALMQAIDRLGLNASPKSSVENPNGPGYSVDWDVAFEDRARFASLVAYLEPTDVSALDTGGRVTFDADHNINRAFMGSPFGSSAGYARKKES